MKKILSLIQKNYKNFSINQDVKDITINVDQIKQKQIDIKTYEINKKDQFYNQKDNKNPSSDIFDFEEPLLQPKNELLQIYGLGNGYFSVNDVWYPGSIIALPNQILIWDVETANDILTHTLDIIEVLKPSPRYIIIGTGKDRVDIPKSVYSKFKEMNINIDIIPTFEACSTFNVCNEDGMNVIAFLIPANL